MNLMYFGSSTSEKSIGAVNRIVVEKSKRVMTLYNNLEVIKIYRIALGFSPQGHKEKQGDGKTPEGQYKICGKNPNSRFHKSLRVSYPSSKDIECAKKNCIADPGNDIMVHGLGRGFSWLGKTHLLKDWTLGCIALTNEEIDEIYDAVKVGATIEIKP